VTEFVNLQRRNFILEDFSGAKKNPGTRGWDGEEYKINSYFIFRGISKLPGIGDQALNITKGLKVISS
jgi:hypothetical protein